MNDGSDFDAWFRHEVQTGIEAADDGDLLLAEEVEADAAEWRTKLQQQCRGKPES
jgi:predicted transcriptional regulator